MVDSERCPAGAEPVPPESLAAKAAPGDGRPRDRSASAQPSLPLVVRDGPPPGPELDALIEALLLAAPHPATPEELARGAGVPIAEVEASLTTLEETVGRGWVVQRHRGTVQLATAPRFAPQIRRFLGLERETRLSTQALETLAIVAYQQPVTRAEVEAVRGVDSAGVLSTLHGRGLIEAVGRLETVGHPIQYGTTPEFLRHFGLRALAELPPLGAVEGRDARVLLESAVATAEEATTPDGERAEDAAGAPAHADGTTDPAPPSPRIGRGGLGG